MIPLHCYAWNRKFHSTQALESHKLSKKHKKKEASSRRTEQETNTLVAAERGTESAASTATSFTATVLQKYGHPLDPLNAANPDDGKAWCLCCYKPFRTTMEKLGHYHMYPQHKLQENANTPTDVRLKHYCGICNLTFGTLQQHLDHNDWDARHKRRSEKQWFWCTECHMPFPTKQAQQKHTKSRHYSLAGAPAPPATNAGRREKNQTKTTEPPPPPTDSASKRKFTPGCLYCSLCGCRFPTTEAYQFHKDFDKEQIIKTYRQKGIAVDEKEIDLAFSSLKFDKDDVDYSQCLVTEDRARMFHVVVELALHNYETFYKMVHGTAKYMTVYNTSAGILGWASCTFEDVKQTITEKVPEEEVSAAATTPAVFRGDKEENRMLRLAMMESMLESRGVCPPCRPDNDGDDSSSSLSSSDDGDNDEDSYTYEDDDGGEYDYGSEEECQSTHSECPDEYVEEDKEDFDNDKKEEGCKEESLNQDTIDKEHHEEEQEEEEEMGSSSDVSGESWSQVSEAKDSAGDDGSDLSDLVVVDLDEGDERSEESSGSDFSMLDFLWCVTTWGRASANYHSACFGVVCHVKGNLQHVERLWIELAPS